ncbi:acyl-CoA thioesterase [Luteolibacter pohnpeiensis]|uniref:Acyl-CoA thioesterase n=1 Tax=Luteolibacter pohnpeiensis TaxID=454153 RepID=A0A934S8K6_9BACT|nr:acyl-CoA thioesterase [Luteolibacter pohnpeiensis]MBK1883798.1 acyl-CoA thioesterase [Luteolibacter pohnpeiensis]
MENHRLVLPGDLNHYGFLFGGRLLAWVDEAAWIAASLDYPDHKFVTIGLDTVEFHHPVRQGTILAIHCKNIRQGNTSVTYSVEVFDKQQKDQKIPIFSTRSTFVAVDDSGNKVKIQPAP